MTSSPHSRRLSSVLPFALVLLFFVADALRVSAALWLVRRNQAMGVEHEFADSELYWKLGLRLAAGESFDDGKRKVLRTPGYPVFLAACIRLFGPSTAAARHVQAAVGAASCVLLFLLVRRLLGSRAAWLAASAAALYPFAVFLSAVLLSESVFTFMLLLQLLCLIHAWYCFEGQATLQQAGVWGALTGLTGAAATLVRPSWFPVTPFIGLVLILLRIRHGSGHAVVERGDQRAIEPIDASRNTTLWTLCWSLCIAAFVLGMTPWWIRNARVTEHFVPTTLWVGASLFDGWNERATGASDMNFMEYPTRYGLDAALGSMSEWEQDRYLRGEAWRFARAHPWRVVELAVVKFWRFWNPMPNAAAWGNVVFRCASLLTCGPAFVLAAVGAWRSCRHRLALAVLVGPVLYFSAIHLVFVSSIRYREAAMVPVLGLAAAALVPRSNGRAKPDIATR